ncbi:MAG: hypothetical protein LBK95_04095 [Bifidobacteriaceae bacterium]|jgi:hypothetical protein|nr:hypothetical protein [Bifidobacteriaceae bacterium]
MAANPFTPSFGAVPPLLAGRRAMIDAILGGLANGPGDPSRASLFVGARGTGKTALLATIANEAAAQGWVAANVTALDGMLEDILERAGEAADEFIAPTGASRLTGLSVAGVSITREMVDAPAGNWRTRMNRLLDGLEPHGIGLLITVDAADIDTPELRQLVAVFQHFVRERRNVALALAGLPQHVSSLLRDKKVSFLRRAFQHRLGPIEEHEVREALRQTVELSGRTIASDALDQATTAAGGFAFLIQLVGYHIWRQRPDHHQIGPAEAEAGIAFARAEMRRMIFETTLAELSGQDRAFLVAMTADESVSQMADIASRLGVSANYANQYRSRLIERGLIGPHGRGRVRFELPMLREQLLGDSKR